MQMSLPTPVIGAVSLTGFETRCLPDLTTCGRPATLSTRGALRASVTARAAAAAANLHVLAKTPGRRGGGRGADLVGGDQTGVAHLDQSQHVRGQARSRQVHDLAAAQHGPSARGGEGWGRRRAGGTRTCPARRRSAPPRRSRRKPGETCVRQRARSGVRLVVVGVLVWAVGQREGGVGV